LTVILKAADRIALADDCPAEDAETLLQHLAAHPMAAIDWRACETAHSAVIQVLMAAKRPLQGPPAGAFLRDYVAPALARRDQFDLS
jgi:hypothetical protein